MNDKVVRLHQSVIGDILIDTYPGIDFRVSTIGFNKFKISTNNLSAANDVLKNEIFTENNLKTFVPLNRLCKVGVIKEIPIKYSVETLQNKIKIDGAEILQVIRFKRKSPNPLFVKSQNKLSSGPAEISSTG